MRRLPHRVFASLREMLRLFVLVCLPIFLAIWMASPGCADTLPRPFTLNEMFGVPHSSQVIDFELHQPVANPGNTYLLDDAGQEVTYQLIDSGASLAFATDLPASTTTHWYFLHG